MLEMARRVRFVFFCLDSFLCEFNYVLKVSVAEYSHYFFKFIKKTNYENELLLSFSEFSFLNCWLKSYIFYICLAVELVLMFIHS